MIINLDKFLAMKISVNIGDLKNRLSEWIDRVQEGDVIEICKRNVPVARIEGQRRRPNLSRPGWARQSGKITGPIEGPILPEGDWHMLWDEPEPRP